MQTSLVRELDLDNLTLKAGGHSGPNDGYCVMEAVAYVAGEPWSDHPQCACPTLSSFLRDWNDNLSDELRQKLKPYVVRLVGTNDGNEMRRSWMCMDWLSCEYAPAFLELAGLGKEAAVLRELSLPKPEVQHVAD